MYWMTAEKGYRWWKREKEFRICLVNKKEREEMFKRFKKIQKFRKYFLNLLNFLTFELWNYPIL
jgi:hypothetical protein